MSTDTQSAWDQANAIRNWIVERTSLLIDNEERAYNEVTDAACRAVLGVDVDGANWYQYSYHYQGGDGKDKYAQAVGEAVSETIDEWIDDPHAEGKSFVSSLLREVLDLSDSYQQYLFGLHYLPEPQDMLSWAVANGEREWADEEQDA